MEIEIFGQLAINREQHKTLTIDHPVTVLEVVKGIDLNPEIIGLVTINGVQSELQDEVKDEDRICFFPYMSGG